jgi:hypothetical protein
VRRRILSPLCLPISSPRQGGRDSTIACDRAKAAPLVVYKPFDKVSAVPHNRRHRFSREDTMMVLKPNVAHGEDFGVRANEEA